MVRGMEVYARWRIMASAGMRFDFFKGLHYVIDARLWLLPGRNPCGSHADTMRSFHVVEKAVANEQSLVRLGIHALQSFQEQDGGRLNAAKIRRENFVLKHG